MKIIFFVLIALFFVITPVYGQFLSDATGLVNRLDVQTGGHSFEIETISNFHIQNFEFDKDEKRLTLFIVSSLENNLGEIQIPKELLAGNFTFYLNEQLYEPQINTNEKISLVTLNFTGSGDNKLDIFGTTYLSGLTELIEPEILSENQTSPSDDGFDYVLVIVILLIIGGVIAVIVFSVKRRSK